MKAIEKERARALRRAGHSIREICELLSVAKSSVSIWVRDIRLTADQIRRLDENLYRNRQRFGYLSRCGGANRNKTDAELRHQRFEQAGHDRAKEDERFRLICAIYWGEGSKRNKTFSISNSDPRLLRGACDWLVRCGYEVKIRFRVGYYAENGLSEEDIKRWWLNQLPNLRAKHLTKFTVCELNRASQQKKIGRLPYGTATIQVCSTELFFQVCGGIRFLGEMGDW